MNARIKATILSRLQPHVVFGIRINPRDPRFDMAPLMIKSLEFLHCTLTNVNLLTVLFNLKCQQNFAVRDASGVKKISSFCLPESFLCLQTCRMSEQKH